MKLIESQWLYKGSTFKILRLEGDEGDVLPKHVSTKDGHLWVEDGTVEISFSNQTFQLASEHGIPIPAMTIHELTALKPFKAILTLPTDANIQNVGML